MNILVARTNYFLLLFRSTILGLVISTYCFSQKTIILDYDYLRNEVSKVSYLSFENDTISKNQSFIKIQEDTPIEIRINNFNNEAVALKTKVKVGQNTSVVQGVSGISSFFQLFSSLIVPNIGVDLSSFYLKRGGSEVQSAEGILGYYPDFSELNSFETEINVLKIDELIRIRLFEISRWQNASSRIKELKFNSNITRDQALLKAHEIIKSLHPNAQKLLEIENNLDSEIQKISLSNSSFLQISIQEYGEMLEKLKIEKLVKNIAFKTAEQNYEIYKKVVPSELNVHISNTLNDLAKDFLSIKSNTYQSRLYLNISEETELIELEFLTKEFQSDSTFFKPVKTKSIFVKGSKGLEFSNSLGLNFQNFFKPEYSYYLDGNSKILGTPSNQVIPTIAATLNFFSPSFKTSKLGGHFGISIPLTSNKKLFYTFGPSIIIGKTNAIILNAGINVGKVNRLGEGLKVGDNYSKNGIIPELGRYEFGYHFGFGFNLSEIISKK